MATGLPQLNFAQLLPLVIHALDHRVSVILFGHPGVGKSSLVQKVAEHFKRPLVDIRLSQRDPSELLGIQMPNRETHQVETYPTDWLKRICTEPCVLFLDEISTGTTKLHQAVAYQILLDRQLGPFAFHPDTLIVAAGNLPEDHAIVTPLSEALLDRCAKFILKVDAESWLDWAAQQQPPISPDIRAYIAWRRETALYKRYDFALASPRSWARAGLLDLPVEGKKRPETSQRKHLIASCVGEAAMIEYFQFHAVYKNVDLDAFLIKGSLPSLSPDDPSLTYAFVFALADRLAQSKKLPVDRSTLYRHIALLMTHRSFGNEFQVLFLKQLLRTKPALFNDMIQHTELEPICAKLATKITQAYE